MVTLVAPGPASRLRLAPETHKRPHSRTHADGTRPLRTPGRAAWSALNVYRNRSDNDGEWAMVAWERAAQASANRVTTLSLSVESTSQRSSS